MNIGRTIEYLDIEVAETPDSPADLPEKVEVAVEEYETVPALT